MQISSVLFVVLTCLLLSACQRGSQDRLDDELAANIAASYDYYMNGVRTTRFAPDGQPAYQLNATRITHYPEGDHAVLDNPDLVWYDQDEKPWQISSLSGDLHKSGAGDENEVLLEGNVVVTAEAEPERPLRITTESLTVQTVSRTATTEAAVTWTMPGAVMQGVGMDLRMEDNHIELLNEVRGTYEP